jgi:carbon starvation protein
MNLLSIVLLAAVALLAAYLVYGRVLARLLRLDPNKPTPAVELRDDVDYVPIEPRFLLSQHFSAIAAAGPIVGPILAGMWFGWGPAFVWILLGSIFIGGVHDITALVASIRHKARSIAEVVREHMTTRSYVVFLSFVWLSLVYIIVAFTDITASSFLGPVATLEDGNVITGEGIATSSLLYLALPVLMGLLLRFTKLTVGWATLIFLPLVGVAIWVGQYIPFDLAHLLGLSRGSAHKLWDVLLLAYCFVASIIPMWLLLQPRGHLGGYFLLFALAGGMLGILFGGKDVEYPMFLGWESLRGDALFPMLFITIACGACSGFHAIIASGTTSKQLRTETDARVIGYGSMLLEAMVAVTSLACVMILSGEALREMQRTGSTDPNVLYARGMGSFLNVLGVPLAFGIAFGLMAFTTFVYDTLDVCTRLGRYILQELFGLHGTVGRWFATGLTAGVPLVFLLWQPVGPNGVPVPAWKTYWVLFGASNQLLAALTLMGVTVWLWRTYRKKWVWLVTGLPTVWMYTMSMWALVRIIRTNFVPSEGLPTSPVPWVALVLVALGALMLVEALRVLLGPLPRPPAPEPEPVALPS